VQACPAGSYCPSTTSNQVIACRPGEYSLASASACTTCLAGASCSLRTAAGSSCTFGYWSPAGSVQCYVCPTGYNCNAAGTNSLTACAAGRYAQQGATACTNCPAGFYCQAKAGAPVQCPKGYYATGSASTCSICPSGSYCASQGTAPVTCIAGRWSPGGLIGSECLPCDPGYWCPAGSTSARPSGSQVAMGYYYNPLENYPSANMLGSCPDGTFGNITGATSYENGCFQCPAGQWCTSTATIVIPTSLRGYCSPGYVCPTGTATATQYPCPAGTYQPLTAAYSFTQCLVCPAVRFHPIC
jgi:hypothetical protein